MIGAADFFKRLQRELRHIENEIAREIVRAEADNFHRRNFRNEGFTDKTLVKWPRRKKEPVPRRALLVKKGHLKKTATHGSTRGNKIDYVMPIYGKVHNEGGRAGRGKGFTMPKRQFLGMSAELDRKIKAKGIRYLNQQLNRL